MKRKAKIPLKRKLSTRRTKPRRLHHKVISFFKGDGGIYVIFVLATVMAGSFALTGGILPRLDPAPPASNEVTIDPDSANQSSESALQLVDLKIKPPTPTLEPTNPITPPPPQECLNNTAINLLVDLSFSMSNNNKDVALRNALKAFVNELEPNTVLGIQVFGSPSSPINSAQERLSFRRYGGAETQINSVIDNLKPGPLGGTYMKSGFELAKDSLIRAKASTAPFRNYRFVSILFSDGVPEVSGATGDACVFEVGNPSTNFYRCFAKAQDPRRFGLDDDIKDQVDKAYSIAIYDDTSGTEDAAMITPLRTLLQEVASGDSSPYYQATTIKSPQQLTSLFQSIVKGICR